MASRILINLTLTAVLTGSGIALLSQGSLSVPEKNNPGHALVFRGMALYLLAGALFGLAAFALAVTRDLVTGRASAYGAENPTAEGRLLARFWHLVATALLCLGVAFALAERTPIAG